MFHDMRKIGLFLSMIPFLLFSCVQNNQKQQNTESNTIKDVVKSDFLEIKQNILKEHFDTENDRKIDLFLERHNETKYADSIRVFKEQIRQKRINIQKLRDSLSKFSSIIYFSKLGLPKLNEISSTNYQLHEFSYKNEFLDFDKSIFKNDFDFQWYLSLQSIGKTVCISVCLYKPSQNYIMLYSIDSLYNIVDKIELYENADYPEVAVTCKYGKYFIAEEDGNIYHAHFLNNSTFSTHHQYLYSIKDTITGNITKEIGKEYSSFYHISKNGRFTKYNETTFKKEYIDLLKHEMH